MTTGTSSSAYTRNHTNSKAFRQLVKLALRAEGILATTKPLLTRKLSVSILDDALTLDHSDIRDVAEWNINTRSEIKQDFSGGLDQVSAEAFLDGNLKSAIVWNRVARPAEQAYVVMTLATFTEVLKNEQANREARA